MEHQRTEDDIELCVGERERLRDRRVKDDLYPALGSLSPCERDHLR